MVNRFVVAVCFMPLLAGCDTFPGPTLTNAYGYDLTITIAYSNGYVSHGSWPACQALLIGAENLQVTKVSIAKDGNVLRELSAGEVQTMGKGEDSAEEPSEWIIGPTGASLVRSAASPCKEKKKE